MRTNHLPAPGMLLVLFLCLPVPAAAQQENPAFAAIRSALRERPFAEVRDSIVRAVFVDILEHTSWKDQQLYVTGTLIEKKDPDYFLGHFLKGWYLSATSTDRRGFMKARDEMIRAYRSWPMEEYAPETGSLDALLARQQLAGESAREQTFRYMLTYYYLQLNSQISNAHLELNDARAAYEVTRELDERGFAYDFYSLTRLAWMYYKYRYFAPGPEYPFLRGSVRENIRACIALCETEQRRIGAYRALKYTYPRYWTDNATLSWYENAANNIISIAYGVIWQPDSAITYYERMPEWFKLRGNGTWLYLADMDYRSAERQFEYVGKTGGEPLSVVSQPTAIDPYKNILFYRGNPEEAYAYLDDYPRKYQEDRGWGMIWLGSANYWNGHLDASVRNLSLAMDYPEVFGNISLNRTHYELVALMQKSLAYDALAHRMAFEPSLAHGFFPRLWDGIGRFFLRWYYAFMSFLCRHWAVDRYLEIGDRAEYLKVFFTENVGDYFQTWNVIRNLDPEWHLQRLREARREDARPQARKFYRVFEAGLLHEAGRDEEALRLISDPRTSARAIGDTSYEKLLVAMEEHVRIGLLGEGGEEGRRRIVELYRTYPQTVLLWGHTLPLAFVRESVARTGLSEGGEEMLEEVLDVFERFDFDFSSGERSGIPELKLSAANRSGVLHIRYNVLLDGISVTSGEIASEERIAGKPARLTPGELARRIANAVFRVVPHGDTVS